MHINMHIIHINMHCVTKPNWFQTSGSRRKNNTYQIYNQTYQTYSRPRDYVGFRCDAGYFRARLEHHSSVRGLMDLNWAHYGPRGVRFSGSRCKFYQPEILRQEVNNFAQGNGFPISNKIDVGMWSWKWFSFQSRTNIIWSWWQFPFQSWKG